MHSEWAVALVKMTTQLIEKVERSIPIFDSSSLLHSKDTCDAIMNAPHGTLASLSRIIKQQLKVTSKYMSDKKYGRVYIEAELATRCVKGTDVAIECVAVGAILTAALRDWPSANFQDVDTCKKEVTKLRKELRNTNYKNCNGDCR